MTGGLADLTVEESKRFFRRMKKTLDLGHWMRMSDILNQFDYYRVTTSDKRDMVPGYNNPDRYDMAQRWIQINAAYMQHRRRQWRSESEARAEATKQIKHHRDIVNRINNLTLPRTRNESKRKKYSRMAVDHASRQAAWEMFIEDLEGSE